MKTPFNETIERGRWLDAPHPYTTIRGDTFGIFRLRCPATGQILRVMASDGDGMTEWHHMAWEHVSISMPNRCPVWEEMCWIKSLFWRDDECVVQFHPPDAEYVNNHAHCLHLWKPIGVEIPLPPSLAVGVKSLGTLAEALRG